jgi:two-component system nitrogen regulation sensor histidine kinase NtrY
MKNLELQYALLYRVIIIVVLLGFGVYLFENHLTYNTILLSVVVILLCIETCFYIRNKLLFYDKTILSILQNDFSTHFSETYKKGNFKNLHLLYTTLKERQLEESSKELIYQSILNTVDTAVLILKKEEEQWSIFMMNDYFSTYFGVPKIKKWEYLKNYIPSLCQQIESTGFSEHKTSVNIKIDQKEAQTFMLQTAITKTLNQEYFVVLLDSIQRVIEKKEKEAWINLMKIISHELMNSLTPIRSLSQSLQEIVHQEKIEEEDLQDIKQSLTTIIRRSDHLQSFVENYRKLTILPSPIKKEVEIQCLFADCLLIMSPILKQESIKVTNKINQKTTILADKNQLEQVIINLITNSIHALADKENKEIHFAMTHENNRMFLTISDTGKGIETAIQDKIFLPFFTTRKDGAGIGLTLSKNIIEAHGGYLSYQTDEEKTHFVICLMGS